MNGARPKILVSQRVVIDPLTKERRDALDQRWARFFDIVRVLPVAVPNIPELVDRLWRQVEPSGVVLTGGNDLIMVGGDAPERDETEGRLLERAAREAIPAIGVCRGMQMIQSRYGITLEPINGHVAPHQSITFEGKAIAVNSYHRFGAFKSVAGLDVVGRSEDGVVKAVRARDRALLGIMWHPERLEPFRDDDVLLFRSHLGVRS
jgi:putative glutamine amidotransferase